MQWLAPDSVRASRGLSLAPPAVIVALMAIHLCCAPFAISHLDFARDVGVALGIAGGERWPLYGPLLNGNLHLGPAWYYLIAFPLWLTHSWIVVVLMIGALAALKFPLAYALGARLVDPWFGVLWALMLGLPGWNSLDVLLMEHTSFVATCVLGFFWMVVRYAETGAPRYLYGVALMYALSLHAHPSTYALALVAIPFLVRTWWASASRWRDLAIAALVFLVPFAPFLASQLAAGAQDIRGAFDYLATAGGLGKLSDVPGVMRGIFVTGPELIAKSVVGIGGSWAEAYSIFYGLLWATVAAGLVSSLSSVTTRRTAVIAVAIVGFVAVSVVLIRAVTPYYMTFVVLTLASGVAALGVRAAMRVPGIRALAYGVTAGVALLPIVLAIGVAENLFQRRVPICGLAALRCQEALPGRAAAALRACVCARLDRRCAVRESHGCRPRRARFPPAARLWARDEAAVRGAARDQARWDRPRHGDARCGAFTRRAARRAARFRRCRSDCGHGSAVTLAGDTGDQSGLRREPGRTRNYSHRPAILSALPRVLPCNLTPAVMRSSS